MVVKRAKPLKKEHLNQIFIDSLGPDMLWHGGAAQFPLECDVGPEPASRFRVYLYTVTRQHGGRPQDEYKIQVILPGHKPRTDMQMDASDGRFPLLGGFSQDFGAFVFWDASLYSGFSYSRNIQVREKTLAESLSNSLSSQHRLLRQGEARESECILACQPGHLAECLKRRLLGGG
jgi:hypothetical protein